MRVKTLRPFIVMGICAALTAIVRLTWAAIGVPLIVNLTPSEPRGVYRIEKRSAYTRGSIVVFPVPETFAELVTSRGWLGPDVPLIKAIGAVPGDRVCVSDDRVEVNESIVGPVYAADSEGRALPTIRGCQMVGEAEFWPLSSYAAKSFDGRYMGPVRTTAIVGEAIPVWTF